LISEKPYLISKDKENFYSFNLKSIREADLFSALCSLLKRKKMHLTRNDYITLK